MIPLEMAEALWSYFTVAGGHLFQPLKGGARAVKPGANFLDNPRGKVCFDLSVTQSRIGPWQNCFELGITAPSIHNNRRHIHTSVFMALYISIPQQKCDPKG